MSTSTPPADPQQPEDRRAHERLRVRRPAKIYDPITRKYIPAVTRNLSKGGALLDTPRSLDLRSEATLQVVIAGHPGQSLLHASDLIDAIVVRSHCAPEGRTSIGLQFLATADLDRAELLQAA